MHKWSVETLSEVVDEELSALPLDMRGRFVRVSQLIEEFGPFKVGMPHIRSLDNKLWEIRVSGRDGIGRGIYAQQTPAKALKTATQRAKEAGLL
jgi:phage-related protein